MHKTLAWISAVAAAVVLAAAPSPAHGQRGGSNSMASSLPTALSQRPLTLPEGTLRLDTNFDIISNFIEGPDDEAFFSWNMAGAGFAPIDDLEIGTMFLPVVFAPQGGFGNMRFYGVYRFVDNESVELGGRLEMVLPTASDFERLDFAMSFGMPVLIRASETVRIDTGIELALHVLDDDTQFGVVAAGGTGAGFAAPPKRHALPSHGIAGIPILVNVNVTDNVFLGGRSGIAFGDFTDDNFDDTVFFPLGFQVGYTLAMADVPLFDFIFRFRWPRFLQTAGDDPADEMDTIELNFAAEIHMDVLGG